MRVPSLFVEFRIVTSLTPNLKGPRNPGISLTKAPERAQYSARLCAPRSTTCRECRVTTALNNQGDQCEIATWISPHHDPAWAIRRTGVIPASSVRRDQWCHIEYANFERANFCSAGNKSGQFQPGDEWGIRRSPTQFSIALFTMPTESSSPARACANGACSNHREFYRAVNFAPRTGRSAGQVLPLAVPSEIRYVCLASLPEADSA